MKLLKQIVVLSLLITLSNSCKEEVLPKPKAQLRLEYPSPSYEKISTECPYIFEVSTNSKININDKCWANLDYPQLNASVNMTYRPVEGNLKELLIEAEKLTFNHTIKADGISSIPYSNKEKRVYGAIFEVTGNAASPIQFHVTDSTDNFITGAVYFNVQPNYDSIKPAISYLRQDIMRMIESMQWKNK
ncbi:MAG: gliding motility lipoprotein GldD [Flavobacteriaceae bacterium]|nr:MAG: gliding motility lipoprotein GldD [Flavobacteriaceae bacterium]